MQVRQSTMTVWLGKLPDLFELRRQGVRDEDVLKMALEGKAVLTRQEVKELSYKSARTGQFFTPEPIAELVAFLGEIQPDETVLDPACGLGDLMFPALNYTKNVDGIELMRETASLSSVVLGLDVKQGNSLEMIEKLKPYDVVLANPPFGRINSLDNWDSFVLNKGKRSNRKDVLFLELCMRVAKRRVVMIVPNSLWISLLANGFLTILVTELQLIFPGRPFGKAQERETNGLLQPRPHAQV